jgi:hypothetical protein
MLDLLLGPFQHPAISYKQNSLSTHQLEVITYLNCLIFLRFAKLNMALKTGYLHDDAIDDSFLQVSDLHTVHYYQFGKKDGKPGKL